MLEEAFKAVEGPVTRRLAQTRSHLTPGLIYSAANRAYEPGISAAVLVLYQDALTVEDAVAHGKDLCQVAADYEKFFNAVSLAAADAVMLARAVPPAVGNLWAVGPH